MIEVLLQLPPEPKELEDRELARFPKKIGTEFVVRVTIYKDTTGVDFREWVDDGSYKGWSKKGVRVPYKDLAKTISLLKEMQQFMASSTGSKASA